MDAILIVLALLTAVLAFYPFTLYPLSLALMPRRPVARGVAAPPGTPITLCFCAYNEERSLPAKLENIRRLKAHYPGLRVLAYVDGSADRTAELLLATPDLVETITDPVRRGKTHGMNRLVARATSEIVVFTDANVLLDDHAIERITGYFADPEIGCVCGHLTYVDERSAAAMTASLQWRLEEFTKARESETGSVMGADGSIFAIRKHLHRVVPIDLIDDMYLSLSILCDGYRIIHAPDVQAFETCAADPYDELRRKIRIACQAVNVHRTLWPRLRRQDPITVYKYVAHRLLRWLTPFLLLLAGMLLVAALALQLGAVVTLAAVLAALLAFVVGLRFRARPVEMVWSVALSLVGVALGVLLSLRGQRFQTWEPAVSVRADLDGTAARLQRRKVVYLAHDLNDGRVRTRVMELLAAGNEVLVLAFRREKVKGLPPLACPMIEFGVTRDYAYLARALSMPIAAAYVWVYRRRLADADLLVARNFEPASLALFARAVAGRRVPVVYEVLDVHRFFVGDQMLNRLFRLMERFVLRRIQLLAVSSPAFIEHHFMARQGYQGPWVLLENKLPAGVAAKLTSVRAATTVRAPEAPWRIGWFGMLRCMRSLELLINLAIALPHRLQVQISGYPTELSMEDFRARLSFRRNICFTGPYRSPEDLENLYRGVDLVWAIDYYDTGGNSEWLLPNRLYEAGFFGVPLLARQGTATGGRIEELGLGWALPEPVGASLEALLSTLTPEAYRQVRRRITRLPRSLFVAGNEAEQLCGMALAAPGRWAATDVLPAGAAAPDIIRARSRAAE
jgi:cellulose synthase/poly-beta-1,6-N-acetylglucosamine synthase-like glycosyltransferase/glycosyltransferase involved in cell wall biosynthesis